MRAPAGPKISHRFLFFGLIPTVALAITVTAYIIMSRISDAESAYSEQGRAYARELAAAAVYGLFVGDNAFLEQTASRYLKRPRVVQIRIFDRDGKMRADLSKTPRGSSYRPGTSTFTEDVIPRRYRSTRILRPRRRRNWVMCSSLSIRRNFRRGWSRSSETAW